MHYGLKLRVKKSWWLYTLLLLHSTFLLLFFDEHNTGAIFFIAFGYGYPLLLVAVLYRYSQNEIFFTPRRLNIDEEKISSNFDDGYTEISWKHILKLKFMHGYWLLYISKNQFIYIPTSAFKSETDLNAFKNLLAENCPT